MDSQKNNGMCRCCASEGTFKDVKTAYQWMGEEEVYADMLRECLDISLCADVTGDVEGGICEVCITQLRNASNFKKQVLHTEDQFKRRLQEGLFKSDIVKVEVPTVDEDSDNDNNLSEDFSGTEFEVPVKTESVEEPKAKKRTAKAKASTSRVKKMKAEDGETSKRKHQDAIAKSVKVINESMITDKVRSRLEREKHYNNTRQVLWCSNATPIRSQGDGGYICCYCADRYPDPADLKTHTLEQHKDADFMNASFLCRININAYYVKLDITDLQCTLCDLQINTVELLLEHLKKIHQRKVYTDINNRLVPFKFSGGTQEQLTCFMCLNVFSKFKVLLEHMNIHYRNFICEICDAGYVTRSMAVTHTKTHRIGTFQCGYCPKIYDTKTKLTNHERVKHTHTEMNKCGICDERFKYYHSKQKHLIEVHGVTIEAKCQACEKVFDTQKKLRVHVRKQHLMDKRHKCTTCEKKFFSINELRDHFTKHTGLKEFQCGECFKFYGRKKTLVAHMKVHIDRM